MRQVSICALHMVPLTGHERNLLWIMSPAKTSLTSSGHGVNFQYNCALYFTFHSIMLRPACIFLYIKPFYKAKEPDNKGSPLSFFLTPTVRLVFRLSVRLHFCITEFFVYLGGNCSCDYSLICYRVPSCCFCSKPIFKCRVTLLLP